MRAEGNTVEIHAEIQRALTHLIADLLDLNAVGLTQDEIVDALGAANATESTITEVRDLIARCDFARFAPSAAAPRDAREVEEAAKRLLDSLVREI